MASFSTEPRLADATRDILRATAVPLRGDANDYDVLLDAVGDAHIVLLGESTHGTHEFYEERGRITQRLITEKGFDAVAVEADWPDALRVNHYVEGGAEDRDGEHALRGFIRFPTWMWRNTEVLGFVEWLRAFNRQRSAATRRVGFYGLDLYSMFTSMASVLRYLDDVDPVGAAQARERYACFDHYGEDSQRYGYATGYGLADSCADAVIAQCRDLQAHAADMLRRDGPQAEDAAFYAQQNARVVVDAEAYYRAMFRGRVSSWNLRDQHMAQTLDALLGHLTHRHGRPAKVVVWEHNSHIGDARATELGFEGEWNVGQLVRERHGNDAMLVGFTTYEGTVTAASSWDAEAENKQVRPALPGSVEALFHQLGMPRLLLDLRGDHAAARLLDAHRLERAIGVVYLPESERQSHYFHASLSKQFDAVLHFDRTRAVEPLEPGQRWIGGETPETYPVGI